MKNLLYGGVLSLLVVACQAPQEKQWFSSSPEIDLAKGGNQAYLDGDWETLRSYFADTATIMANSWDQELTPDEYIGQLQESVSTLSEYSIGDDGFWEMVVTDDGEKWVHAWFEWNGTHNNGTEMSVVVHISWRFVESKVVFMGVIYDTLPFYMAENPPQEADTTAMEETEE